MSMGVLVGDTTAITGGAVILAQMIPGVPDDFKSWPLTAIGGLLALAGMTVAFLTMKGTQKSLTAIATTMATQAEAQHETNDKLGEMATETRTTNTELRTLSTELRARKCLVDK